MVHRTFVCFLGLWFSCALASAQEAEWGTAADPAIPLHELQLVIQPLTAADVVVEADHWRDRLRDKVVEINAREIELARTRADGGDTGPLMTQLDTAKGERSALRDRLHAVLASLTAKGGDAEEYEKYIDAVTGTLPNLDVTNVTAAAGAVRDWLLSWEGGLLWGKNLILFLVVLLVFRILSRVTGRLLGKALGRFGQTSELLRDFLTNMVRKLIFLIGVIVGVSMLGVDIGPFVAAIGAAGLVVGFALQGTLSNFASGIMILLYRPYDVGDVINAGGVTGKVDSMSLVSTTVTTPDNQCIVVPNNSIWSGVITNVTARDTRRVDLIFGIGYSDDIDKARKVLGEVMNGHELVLGDPEPMVEVSELADSSVNFVVRPWVKTSDYWQVYWDLHRLVKQRFDAEGISIPFPQRDVHVHQVTVAQ